MSHFFLAYKFLRTILDMLKNLIVFLSDVRDGMFDVFVKEQGRYKKTAKYSRFDNILAVVEFYD